MPGKSNPQPKPAPKPAPKPTPKQEPKPAPRRSAPNVAKAGVTRNARRRYGNGGTS